MLRLAARIDRWIVPDNAERRLGLQEAGSSAIFGDFGGKLGKVTMLTADQVVVMKVAADIGAFSMTREYNNPWPSDYALVKQLASDGLMKFESLERNPETRALTRKYSLTESGKVALDEAMKQLPQSN